MQEDRMKILPVFICVMMSFSGVAMAAPYASLMPLNAKGKQMMKASGKTDAQRAIEAPDKDEINIPAYPGSFLGMTGGTKGHWSSLQLISNDSPGKIIAWYKSKLGKKWQFSPSLAIEQAGQVGVFIETNKPEVDGVDLMKFRAITIAKVEKPGDLGFAAMFGDLSNAKAVINIQLKPLM